ncbi:hypothetical protein C8R41DRAFT_922118 [Lentinula lateritia]|uniref:Actin cytoskeleton-regulatory complex protein SLA1 n=1 Tax=Lentinula lateritia TaxID=40482 RepID=A0ABQ8VAQ0_9AGAR|nr:hypothetical protein C8R41DRAFT_922118 [Lentinula lateritia]
MAEPEEYLAVLKASYDYEPQSDDEISIKENQILFLKERLDEDWWRVKVKGESQDQSTPTGLVPAAYVEQADHLSLVKTLYDYEASAPGELTIIEGEILLAFEPDDEWLLVQSTKEGGKAGYIPANYVETYVEGTEEEATEEQPANQRIIVPPSPTPSPPSYVDPADRVASSKLNADDIKTWSVSEVDKKGKKMKGTLGIGSGAVFFASETSKAAVQKWPTSSISNINVEKTKHVHFDVEGGVSLHFNVGSKDNCEAIVAKLESSKALALQSSEDAPAPTPTRAPPPPSLGSLPARAVKASVHFAPESPAIIPSPPEAEDPEPEEEEEPEEVGEMAVALYPFTADGDDELSVIEGEQLLVLEKDGDEWWKCRNAEGAEGVVPASYIELAPSNRQTAPRSTPLEEEPEEEEEKEDIAAKEAQARERAEAEAAAAAAAERARKEEEGRRERDKEKERKKKEAQARAKAAEAERAKRTQAAAVSHPSPPPSSANNSRSSPNKDRPSSSSGRTSAENRFPPADRVRIWHDRSGQFRVEAALLSFKDGKLRLHKINGVIVEVPSEKMSVEDMRYVDKLLSKKSHPPTNDNLSDDDTPLALHRSKSSGGKVAPPRVSPQPKKGPTIDWFDFFLTAGCDLDDCTRYAASFERDKIDESILPDITESTMRSLGLREGDIIRVTKAIEKRRSKSADKSNGQLARDEALAKQLQAQESGDSPKVTAPPNLFANGPNGVLKPGRRGRPQPTKSLSSAVDLNTISEVSDKIQRTESPSLLSPGSAGTPVQPPVRSSSAAPVASGFDDDAWTNRPISTEPLAPASRAPPVTASRAPSAPPTSVPAQAVPVPTPPNPPVAASVRGPPSLANTTEDDVFQQLARLSELRKSTVPAPAPSPSPITNLVQMGTPSPIPHAPTPPIAPTGYQSGMGMSNSPIPMGQHLQAQQTGIYGPGPRGPYAPVPSNQNLLQPLVPTQTGFNGFVPTRANNVNLSQPSFLQSQPTGFPTTQPMISYPNGFPMTAQPTGMPFGGMNGGMTGLNSGMNAVNPFGAGGVMTNPTGFNPAMGPNFNAGMSSPPPVPPLPSATSNHNSTNPANIFAQMKSGTFANDNESSLPNPNYDALRPQPTGWGGFQGTSYVGYQ